MENRKNTGPLGKMTGQCVSKFVRTTFTRAHLVFMYTLGQDFWPSLILLESDLFRLILVREPTSPPTGLVLSKDPVSGLD